MLIDGILKNSINSSGNELLIILIVCYQILGESNKEISLILICGFFIEFLLISSSKNNLKKQNAKKERG